MEIKTSYCLWDRFLYPHRRLIDDTTAVKSWTFRHCFYVNNTSVSKAQLIHDQKECWAYCEISRGNISDCRLKYTFVRCTIANILIQLGFIIHFLSIWSVIIIFLKCQIVFNYQIYLVTFTGIDNHWSNPPIEINLKCCTAKKKKCYPYEAYLFLKLWMDIKWS